MCSKVFFHFLLLVILSSLSACAASQPASYEPYSKLEEFALAKATRDIYPADVRQSLSSYKDKLVVWTGIIRQVNYYTEGPNRAASFLVEHRFFDWYKHDEDPEGPYILEPQGEGLFKVARALSEFVDMHDFRKMAREGNIIVAYGRPARNEQGIIHLATYYIRLIDRDNHASEVAQFNPHENSSLLD